jgi:hypothetical protein
MLCLNLCHIYGMYIVDEVESLAAARQAAISGSEPSDSIRVSYHFFLTTCDYLGSWLMFTVYLSLCHFRL